MSESNRKGLQLEDAVRHIEEAIINADPALKSAGFEIRTRERVRVGGVLHEIDVTARANHGAGYGSLHIFECKNWRKPVGKNEVILLAEKVEATGAAKGYLVGRKFTRDAIAFVSGKPRLQLVHCSSDFVSPLDYFRPIATTSDFLALTLQIKQFGIGLQNPPLPMQADSAVCFHENRAISLAAFAMAEAETGLHEYLDRRGTWQMMEGSHTRYINRQVTFSRRELWIGDKEIEWIFLTGTFLIHIRLPVITSKFEVEGRGRIYDFEAPETHSFSLPAIKIQLVQKI